MNRQQRRKYARQSKLPFNAVKSEDEIVDRTKQMWCWLHPLQLDNIDNPTERDKKLIEAIRLIPFKQIDPKTGEVRLGRSCKKCGNTVWADPNKQGKEASIEGYTTEPKEDKMNLWH